MVGIVGYGVYLPRYRIEAKTLQRVWTLIAPAPGVKEKSVPNVDEDSLTMAVIAGENALHHAGIDGSRVGAVCMGTVSSPYVDKSLAVLLAEVLGIPSGAIALDFGGSVRAGTLALENCLSLIESGRIEFGLVVGADNQIPLPGDILEYTLGAGAGAFVLGKEGVIAEIGPVSSFASSYTYVWRTSPQKGFQRYDDPRQYREQFGLHISKVLSDAMKKSNLAPDKYSQVVIAQPDGEIHKTVAKSLGFGLEATKFSTIASLVGDTGSSSVMISLAAALDQSRAGDRIMVASFGSGSGSDAFPVLVQSAIEDKRAASKAVKEYLEPKDKVFLDFVQYEKILGRVKGEYVPDAFTAFPLTPGMIREQEYHIGLKAQECKKCGSLNFPRRRICIEPDCRSREFIECRLPKRGKIETYYVQHVVYLAPEEGPFPICIARLDGAKGEYGGKISAMMTDFKLDELKIGMPVELVFRKCGEEKGMVKYGYKFKPVKEGM